MHGSSYIFPREENEELETGAVAASCGSEPPQAAVTALPAALRLGQVQEAASPCNHKKIYTGTRSE